MRLPKILVIAGCLLVSGCAIVEFAKPEKPPHYREIWQVYLDINVKQSTSADVLTTIKTSDYELISQSTSVIASAGQKRNTRHNWMNMVAFDQDDMTVRRKHLLIINEKPKIFLGIFTPKWEGASYDSRIVLEKEVLDEPYANNNARRIAILRKVLESVRGDIDQVAADNKTIEISGMVINQALEAALQPMDSSPALAARLSEPAGLDFHHRSFDKGKIQMLIDNDVVTVKVMLGSFVRYFETRTEPKVIEQKRKEEEQRLPLPPKI